MKKFWESFMSAFQFWPSLSSRTNEIKKAIEEDFKNDQNTGFERDKAALKSDWEKVGTDLENAFEKFKQQNNL